MTCKDLHEQITAYVDDMVDEAEYRAKVEQHIKQCPQCRAAFEMELVTKTVIREHAHRTAAPSALRDAIAGGVDAIARERVDAGLERSAASGRGVLDRFSHIFTAPVGVALACILIVVAMYEVFHWNDPHPAIGSAVIVESGDQPAPEPKAAGPENFFNKAASNFQAIVAGQLGVQHATDDCQELKRYFHDSGIAYPVTCVPMPLTLAGGVVSEHGRSKFAHLVYSADEVVVYVFEVPKSALQRGDVVYVTSEIMRELDAGKVFWEEPGANAHLAMFERGDIVYAVVSNAPRPRMEQLLALK